MATNGFLLFESFSGEQGPASAQLYYGHQVFGPNSVSCLEINNACDTKGSDPAWSPDGGKILFVGETGDLFVVDTLGTHLRPVVDADGLSVRGLTPTWVGPAWNGISYAGVTTDSGVSSYDILYAPITIFDDRVEIGEVKNLTPHIAGDFSPSWNPTGTAVVFESNRQGGDIFRIDEALSNSPTLTNLTADRPASGEFKPDWSPDGTKIAYSSTTSVSDIWVMDADGTNARNVTNDAASDDAPAWSPDGRFIVYVRSSGGDPDIYTIGMDGTDIRQVSDNGLFDWNPDWQPLPEADVNIEIRDVADPVAVEDVAEYTIKVKNSGPDSAINVRVITEPLPGTVDFNSIINPSNCTLGGDRRVTCVMGDAEAGRSLTAPLKLRLNQPGAFTLTGRVYTDSHDSEPINDTTSETTTVALSADVGVFLEASASPVTTIEALTYTLSVTNSGPSTAFDVVVTNTLPADLDFVSVTSTLCDQEERIVTCRFDAIDPLKILQVNYIVAKKSTDTLINRADVVVNGSIDNYPFNDHATLETPVVSPVDTDGDSLFDVWENKGIDANLDGIIDLDLRALGASADHKDLFIEVDTMSCLVGGCISALDFSTEPIKGALDDVVTAFANAPVENPDGSDGIKVHILLDESMQMGKDTFFTQRGPFDHDDFDDYKIGSNQPDKLGVPCGIRKQDGHFGTRSERASENCENILEARRLSYRYAIFGVNFVEGTVRISDELSEYSSGIAERGGNDFMVTFGTYNDDNYLKIGGSKVLATAKRAVQAGTFMHELGHTLGLAHGGDQEHNLKPNYMSVMNYDLQVPNLDPNRPLDYSTQTLPDLDERSLDESAGVSGAAGRMAIYHGQVPLGGGLVSLVTLGADAGGPIDWNLDGSLGPGRVSADINEDQTLGILRGFDDWANLQFNFRVSPEYANGVRLSSPDDQTVSEFIAAAESIDTDEDGVSNADDNCPASANADQADSNGDGVGDVCQPATGTVDLRVEAAGESLLTEEGPIIVVKFYVTNSGALPAANVMVAVPTVPDTAFLSSAVPAGVTCTEVGGMVSCSGFGDLGSGKTVTGRLIFEPGKVGAYSHEVQTTTAANDADVADNMLASVTVVTRNTLGLGWQNESNHLDVDDNGVVAPRDALVIVNELNSPEYVRPGGKLPIPPDSGVVSFFDVDGNGFAVPRDALFVINVLNGVASPEGEGSGMASYSMAPPPLDTVLATGRLAGDTHVSQKFSTLHSSSGRPVLSLLVATPVVEAVTSSKSLENDDATTRQQHERDGEFLDVRDLLFAML